MSTDNDDKTSRHLTEGMNLLGQAFVELSKAFAAAAVHNVDGQGHQEPIKEAVVEKTKSKSKNKSKNKSKSKRAEVEIAEVEVAEVEIAEVEVAEVAEVAEVEKIGLNDCREAMIDIIKSHGTDAGRGLLKTFGVKRASDLEPDQYAAFVDACTEMG